MTDRWNSTEDIDTHRASWKAKRGWVHPVVVSAFCHHGVPSCAMGGQAKPIKPEHTGGMVPLPGLSITPGEGRT